MGKCGSFAGAAIYAGASQTGARSRRHGTTGLSVEAGCSQCDLGGVLPGSALLSIRVVLTALVVAAAWRFGLRGVLATLVIVAALLILLKARKTDCKMEDWR